MSKLLKNIRLALYCVAIFMLLFFFVWISIGLVVTLEKGEKLVSIEAYEMLQTVSFLLFGILGAWFAVFAQAIFLNEKHSPSKLSSLTSDLFLPLRNLIYLLTIFLSFPFIGKLAYSLLGFAPNLFTTFIFSWSQYVFWGGICVAWVWILYTLLLILRPFNNLKRELDREIERQDIRDSYKL